MPSGWHGRSRRAARRWPCARSGSAPAPRAGDAAFAALEGKAHWCVVNEGDIEPHVPSEMFFRHAGKRRLLADGGVWRSDGAWSRLQGGRLGLDLQIWAGGVLRMADTHRLSPADGNLPRLVAAAKTRQRRQAQPRSFDVVTGHTRRQGCAVCHRSAVALLRGWVRNCAR